MKNDPIVQEVRELREQLAAESDFDLTRIVDALRRGQARDPGRVVALPPKRVGKVVARRPTA